MKKIRRKGRIAALSVCYQMDIRNITSEQTALKALEDMHLDKEVHLFAEMLTEGVLKNRALIDELISKYSINWDISRMGYIDRNILRIAVYEMIYLPDVPHAVAIDEAIEIAKIYGSLDSGKFINGILDRIGKKLSCEKDTEDLPASGK